MSFDTIFKLKSWNEKIKFFRQLHGLTQDQLADRIGTTQKQVYLWESGRKHPNRISQKAIARAFNTKDNQVTEEMIFNKSA